MSSLIVNEAVTCPHCWERIVVAVDTSVPQQQYVEDCSVCCRPIVVTCTCVEGSVTDITLEPESA
ncbi:MAG: CPXCG motif-containing cysteine-rich protein [Gammaproteobacteria bacterium]|nr:CPXCG motif-containing cysteine-rich protein [Gammaproteobacteria bacterium]